MNLFKLRVALTWLITILAITVTSSPVHSFNSLNIHTNLAPDTAFVGGNVLNPSDDITISNATILVSNGQIAKIQPSSYNIPANYSVIDIKGKWVIPGLIDGHIHLAQSGGAFTRPDTINGTKIVSYEDDQKWLLANTTEILNDYLTLGITSVFDLGGPSEYLTHYRDVSKKGVFPDIYAAGSLLSPMDMPQLNLNGKTFTKVNTAKEAETLVREQLKLNTSIVKIVWSQETGLSSSELFDLYKPAIELAKRNGKILAVHVEDLVNAKEAIKAGADILVHGVMSNNIDDEFIQLMKNNNVTYMPTLSAYSHYFELFKNELAFTDFEYTHSHETVTKSFEKLMENVSDTDQMFQIFLKYVPMVDASQSELAKLSEQEQSIVGQLRAVFSSNFENIQKSNLKAMIASGVNVAFGTDAGNPGTLHGSSVIGEMVEWQKAGVSNKDILKAATFGNANALNLNEKLGALLTGKQADFVVLAQNPYEQLITLITPELTVKKGSLIYPK